MPTASPGPPGSLVAAPQLILAWRIYLLFGVLQGLVALVYFLLAIPQSEAGLFFGLSAVRLAMLLVLLALTAWLSINLAATWLAPQKTGLRLARLSTRLASTRQWTLALTGSLLLGVAGCFSLTLTPEISEPYTQAYFIRLAPLLALTGGLGFQTTLALLLLRRRRVWAALRPASGFYLLFLLANLVIFLAWGWMVRNQLASEIILTGWYELGTPLLGWQVALASLASLGGLLMIQHLDMQPAASLRAKARLALRFDVAFSLGLWLGTVLLWNAIPLQPTWFVSAPRAPNYEYYPNSDALKYDLSAQNLLVGEGWKYDGNPFVRRPMHSLLLVGLHVLVGQDYTALVFWQILFLATLPVAVYALTISLANRPAGILAAVLVAIREANSIAIAATITTSHAKLLMSDLPATLFTVLCMAFAIRWLQGRSNNPFLPTLTGFALGLATLVRSELGFLAIAILGISLLVSRRPFRLWLVRSGYFLLGLTLVLLPLIYRNWSVTGLIFLDSPSFRIEKLIERFRTVEFTPPETDGEAGAPGVNPAPIQVPTSQPTPPATQAPTGTTPAPPTQDNPPLPYLDYVGRTLRNVAGILQTNGASVLRFVTANFTNSQIQTYILLPMTYRGFDSLTGFTGHGEASRLWYECCSLLEYVRRLPFWRTWDGHFPTQAILPLIANILLITFGLGLSWQRVRWVALLPVVASTVHFSINAIFRNSGGRFIMPVDWTYLLFYCIGLAEIVYLIAQGISARCLSRDFNLEASGANSTASMQNSRQNRHAWSYPALLLAILLVGSGLPLAERSVPPVYTAEKQAAMLDAMSQSSALSPSARQELRVFLQNGGQVIAGSGLYPRFYRAGQGEPGSPQPMAPQPFSRLGFYLVGPVTQPVVLPVTEPVEYFPDASPALVFTCPDQSVLAVAVFEGSQPAAVYLTDPRPPTLTCHLDYPVILEPSEPEGE